jgi:hypothetical protein
MPVLRMRQSEKGEGRYRVDLELDGSGDWHKGQPFDLQFSAQDREDIRWYLEDFLQYPMAPAPVIAARIELRMAEIGADLSAKAAFRVEYCGN